jgi:hypothetical protein
MTTTYRGGCLCGAIRYEIAAEPMFGGHCQCLDCQHETGGGHASFMAFPAAAVKLTGTPRFYEAKADSGNQVGRGFCPTCGSAVVGRTSGLPDMMTIPAGSLSPRWLWTYDSTASRCASIDPNSPSFSRVTDCRV